MYVREDRKWKAKDGHCRNRTGDLMHAKHTRCQLRQAPIFSIRWVCENFVAVTTPHSHLFPTSSTIFTTSNFSTKSYIRSQIHFAIPFQLSKTIHFESKEDVREQNQSTINTAKVQLRESLAKYHKILRVDESTLDPQTFSSKYHFFVRTKGVRGRRKSVYIPHSMERYNVDIQLELRTTS